MKSILNAVLLVGLISLFGCAEISGKPSASENDWTKFQMAGFNLGWGKTKDTISVGWQFILQVNNEDIKKIKIYDITEPTETLLVDDNSVTLNNGNWIGKTTTEEVKKNSDHWVFSNADISKKFKAVLTDSKGQTRELVQKTNHSAKERRQMLMILG